MQGTSTCNANYAGGASGSTSMLSDTVAPATGTATAVCTNGAVTLTAPLCVTAAPPPPPPPPPNPVTHTNIVDSCAGCHGLTSNGVVFKSGGYTVTGRSAQNWLTTVNNMINRGSTLATGTTAQNYADFLANPN